MRSAADKWSKRLSKAGSKDFGVQVPAGTRLKGWHFLAAAIALTLFGLGALLAGGHNRLVLAGALWLGAILLVIATLSDETPADK